MPGRRTLRALAARADDAVWATLRQGRSCCCATPMRPASATRPASGCTTAAPSATGAKPAATRAALALLRGWDAAADGTLLVVTHQVNITALTGVAPAFGAGAVLAPGSLAVFGEAVF